MLSLILKILSFYSCVVLGRLLFRRFVLRTDLDNIPGPPRRSVWTGNFKEVFNIDGWDFHRYIAETYGSVIRVHALFGEKQLYIFDPKALHHIIVKDQYIYEETDQFIQYVLSPPALVDLLGEHHRKQRKMLNPVFSIAHMRQMVPIFYNVAHKLQDAITSRVENGPREVEIVQWMTRTALELIGQSGLGYSFDSLEDEVSTHPYCKSVKELVPTSFRMFLPRSYILPHVAQLGPPWFRRFLVNILPWKNLHHIRDIIDTIHQTSVTIFEEKKQALKAGDEAVSRQIGQGKDIMSILMRANMEASDEDRLLDSEVLGQMSTLTFAAMDTTSGALSRILYLLALHPAVQEKLHREISAARLDNRDVSYDELVALPYLDAVCRETLRLHPPLSTIQRIARQDIVLPLANPIRGVDDQEMHQISVPKNTVINLSILNSNRNPAIWGADSYEWKPERWLGSLPETLVDARIPGIYSHL
ncbi:cytochrome P450 [Infundibulicybe gibba]|nr:cytochrome P450 [Infundibulicybe gibba]